MGLVLKTNNDFETIPTGLQNAVCSVYWDIGVQPQIDPKTGKEKLIPQVVLLWELEERKKDGSRFYITKTYTQSLHEKSNLRKDLKNWRGRDFTAEELRGFNLDKILGKLCTLTIQEYTTNQGKTGYKIATVNPPQRNAAYIESELPEDFIPKWIEEKIAGITTAPVSENRGIDFEDDIPF